LNNPVRKGHWLFVVTFLIALACDLGSKYLIESRLAMWEEYEIWEGIFRFRLITNPGMMWGMAESVPAYIWVVIRGCVLVGLIWMYASLESHGRLAQLAFGLVCAGALGNIYDNIFQNPEALFAGEVRDFLQFYWFEFPTFNVADSCICVGAPLLLIVLWGHDRQARLAEEAAS
jgi:signal peptidase II